MRKLVEAKTLNVFVEEAQKLLEDYQFKYMEAILRFMFMIASGGTSYKLSFPIHLTFFSSFNRARQSRRNGLHFERDKIRRICTAIAETDQHHLRAHVTNIANGILRLYGKERSRFINAARV